MIPSQITVGASGVPQAAGSNLRVALMLFGAWAVGRGWFKQDTIDMVVPIALIAVPWAWGQVKGWTTHRKLASIAADPRVPDAVATIK
jgi:hypothetical protein